jgi:uracil-DNA glycosylase family 4
MSARELERIAAEIVACRSCPRLVEWRERVARDKTAAHGGNRTGRIFTGDRSGDFLFASLHRVGLSNRPTSVSRDDGLRLIRAYLSAVNRCAPPANKPTPAERDTCLPFLAREIAALERLRVLVALGAFAWDGALRALSALGHPTRPRPRFGHAAEASVGPFVLLGSYHPSQQNTFTGKLTPQMLDTVFDRAAELAG